MPDKDSKLNSFLTEYQELRSEIRQLVDHQMKLYALLLTTIGAIIGVVFSTKTYDILLILPIISLGFAFRYIFNSKLLILLGDYLKKMDEEIFQPILNSKEDKIKFIGWQSYFSKNYNILPFHKVANLIIFILIPFLSSIIYCTIVIIGNLQYISTKINIETQLPIIFYIILLVVFIILGSYLAFQLWEIEPKTLKNYD